MAIAYNLGKGEYKNWIISETEFNENNLPKFETIFSLGNGYMGLRAATEEHYFNETRGCYVAGMFDRFKGEVAELPNIPDYVGMEIKLDGERFNLNQGKIISYHRYLNVKDGELVREVEWQSPAGNITKLVFKRFVSLANLHLAGFKIKIIPVNYSGKVAIKTGYNGQVTNSGVQHFVEGDKRVLPDGKSYLTVRTQESGIFTIVAGKFRFLINASEINPQQQIVTGRRQLFLRSEYELKENECLEMEKCVIVYTGRDLEFKDKDIDSGDIVETALTTLDKAGTKRYEELFSEHRQKWHKLWHEIDIEIGGPDFDQLAVRFAQYHLVQMTPSHDSRISVAAKGLSGEGYKGHVFWDTEIFILPFFIYTFPQIARKLLEYRYHTLDGARKKARENGYKGAMYPWESADTGEETTPEFGEVDIKTGKPIRIWCGEIEQHITADVAYAIWHYYQVTGDKEFMYNYGTEIFMETARFWASRLEYNQGLDRYEIKDVIGPDEYSEHVNNNAYTNYMVKWHLEKAIDIYNWLSDDSRDILEKIINKIALKEDELNEWKKKKDKIYLPFQEDSKVIPQFDGFMDQDVIDISSYRGDVGAIMKAYSWDEITSSQVIKQADVVMLLYLLGEDFSHEVKEKNYHYYEPKTLHDSSLSPSIHAIMGKEIGDLDEAYRYFNKSTTIDLGRNMRSCDAGLHSASLGGIWQAVVLGFGGVKVKDNVLNIDPMLPEKWDYLNFKLKWQGMPIRVEIRNDRVSVSFFK